MRRHRPPVRRSRRADSAMTLLPRRVGHGELAELVEHLGELRHRLAISAGTLGLAFALTFIFRETIIGWLNAPLEGKEPITLGVAEPFTTSLLVSFHAALALSLPVHTVVGVGALFELPVFLLGLVRLGVLSAARLRRNRRKGIVVLVAISVALPGVDPLTTLLQTIPLLVLFEASIWAAPIVERRRSRVTTAAQPAPET